MERERTFEEWFEEYGYTYYEEVLSWLDSCPCPAIRDSIYVDDIDKQSVCLHSAVVYYESLLEQENKE